MNEVSKRLGNVMLTSEGIVCQNVPTVERERRCVLSLHQHDLGSKEPVRYKGTKAFLTYESEVNVLVLSDA